MYYTDKWKYWKDSLNNTGKNVWEKNLTTEEELKHLLTYRKMGKMENRYSTGTHFLKRYQGKVKNQSKNMRQQFVCHSTDITWKRGNQRKNKA